MKSLKESILDGDLVNKVVGRVNKEQNEVIVIDALVDFIQGCDDSKIKEWFGCLLSRKEDVCKTYQFKDFKNKYLHIRVSKNGISAYTLWNNLPTNPIDEKYWFEHGKFIMGHHKSATSKQALAGMIYHYICRKIDFIMDEKS